MNDGLVCSLFCWLAGNENHGNVFFSFIRVLLKMNIEMDLVNLVGNVHFLFSSCGIPKVFNFLLMFGNWFVGFVF